MPQLYSSNVLLQHSSHLYHILRRRKKARIHRGSTPRRISVLLVSPFLLTAHRPREPSSSFTTVAFRTILHLHHHVPSISESTRSHATGPSHLPLPATQHRVVPRVISWQQEPQGPYCYCPRCRPNKDLSEIYRSITVAISRTDVTLWPTFGKFDFPIIHTFWLNPLNHKHSIKIFTNIILVARYLNLQLFLFYIQVRTFLIFNCSRSYS